MSYADSFSLATLNGNKFAYPTYNKLAKSKGVLFMPSGTFGRNGERYNGQAFGSFAKGDARIEISGRYVDLPPMPPSATPENVQWVINQMSAQALTEYSQTALGETIHRASLNGFTDSELAAAASKLTGIPGYYATDDYRVHSLYFHYTVLRSICR